MSVVTSQFVCYRRLSWHWLQRLDYTKWSNGVLFCWHFIGCHFVDENICVCAKHIAYYVWMCSAQILHNTTKPKECSTISRFVFFLYFRIINSLKFQLYTLSFIFDSRMDPTTLSCLQGMKKKRIKSAIDHVKLLSNVKWSNSPPGWISSCLIFALVFFCIFSVSKEFEKQKQNVNSNGSVVKLFLLGSALTIFLWK